MSFNHGENRNSANINQLPSGEQLINTLPRPSNIIGNRYRCCSFCREPGHTITFCNDGRLQDFKSLCEMQKEIFENNRETSRNPKRAFKEWVINYSLENTTLVKAFAIRNCGSNTRDPIQANIDAIVDHFFDEYYGLPDLIDDNNDLILLTDDLFNNPENVRSLLVLLQMQAEAITNLDYAYTRYRNHYNNHYNNDNDNEGKFTIETQVVVEESKLEPACECNICYNSTENAEFIRFNCNHDFCKECVKGILKACNTPEGPKCAFCRSQITCMTYKSAEVKTEFVDLINEPHGNSI